MVKVTILSAVATLACLCGSIAASKDSCVPIDFTTKASEFAEMNAVIKSPASTALLAALVGNYDPLTRENVVMDNINYDFMGQFLTISPVIHSMRVTGLSSIAPQFIKVDASNSVSIGVASSSQVAVNCSMSVRVQPLGLSVTIQLQFALNRPKAILGIEANMLACAPGVPASQCTDLTVAALQSRLASATTRQHYVSIMKEVLMKFESASVTAFLLDFKSISGLTVKYSSPDMLTKSFLHLLPTFVDAVIDKHNENYKTVMAKMSASTPSVLNTMMNSSLVPFFGKTCLSEE